MIFNIQKCSVHDGSGLRSLVFFKGCSLSCKWCANPESQSFQPEIMESTAKCIGCLRCQKECPNNAIALTEQGPLIQREQCAKCFHCTDICYAGAKYVTGETYTVEELFHKIEKDRMFFTMSGGGVTFSGGEPFAQPKLLTQIAKKCHDEGIHVMLESCGYADYESFRSALPYIDAMFMDIKHIDSDLHRELTGKGNKLILENIQKIADFGIPITIRTPIVPGYNDSEANVTGIAEFIKAIPNIRGYELLSYHNLGESKYRALGRSYPLTGVSSPSKEQMDALTAAANRVLEGSQKTCFYLE